MQIRTIKRLANLTNRNKTALHDVLLLAAFMAVAIWAAYEFDVFPNAPGIPPQEHIIELDEALGLGTLLCLGLLCLAWRFLLAQRREVARRIAAETVARELAREDALTGLPNRRRFDEELKAAIEAPPRSGGAHGVLLLDLTGFKRVNDLYGHGIGDEALVTVARRLKRAIRKGDLVARFGGDEFAILATQLSGAEDATSIALRVIKELDEPIIIGSVQHRIGVGIGITLFPKDGVTGTELLRKADIALYRAKGEQRSAPRFFEEEMDVSIRERDFMERELRLAIANGSIQPYFQPMVDLRSRDIIGFEALARWTHHTLGNVPPERFIPIAESCGLISELSDHLLRSAAHVACQWPDETILSFNISASQLRDSTLGLRILSILAKTGLSTWRLKIELAESALVGNMRDAQELLGALHDAGVRISARRLRHRVFKPLSFAQFQGRHDKDRPQLHREPG